MRAIIIAAGEATRWNNYTGVAKHFVKLCSEPILHRTVRLLHENNVDDIWVVGLTTDYKIEHSNLCVPTINYVENADADKFLSSKALWHTSDRTVVLYGDCYFSEKAMQTIVNSQNKDWTLFCRPTPSEITGTLYGECFAQSFYPEHLEMHEKNLHRIAELYKAGKLHRCGGWEHYRAMAGKEDLELDTHLMSTNFVEINDWTEDFDVPADYDNWTRNRKKYNEAHQDSKIINND